MGEIAQFLSPVIANPFNFDFFQGTQANFAAFQSNNTIIIHPIRNSDVTPTPTPMVKPGSKMN